MRGAPLIAAVAFAVLSVLAVIVVPLGPGIDESGADVVEHLAAHAGMIRLRALLTAAALIALAVVIGYARERLHGPAGHAFLLGAAVLMTQLVVQSVLMAGLVLHASALDPVIARTVADIASMWGPLLTVSALLLAGPVIWASRRGRFPRWLALIAAVLAVEQLVAMLTIIGPMGSFISPDGPMTVFLGGGLYLAFLCALGFATAMSDDAEAVARR